MKTLVLILAAVPYCVAGTASWTVVDTGQELFYDEREPIPRPERGEPFHGQDAEYRGVQASYCDNGDGTVSDLKTGLMWSQAVAPEKLSLEEAKAEATGMRLGRYEDWRVPTIKELYSLIDFRGRTGDIGAPGSMNRIPADAIPYLNTDYFDYLYGNTAEGERFMDAQWLTSTEYPPGTMGGIPTLFGVNFADGRIKGYGYERPGGEEKKFFVRYVRGREDYGKNEFLDNGDGTVTDRATGLMWSKADSGVGVDWEEALALAGKARLGGYHDWRLPNAKELQSIVDYSRSPDETGSPALDPVFQATSIRNEAGETDYPFYWTSTTHEDGPNASQAIYIAFGRAIGEMRGTVMDVHGAGAQRSDPKTGEGRLGHGPQGDAQRVRNYVRLVRGGSAEPAPQEESVDYDRYPNVIRVGDEAWRPVDRDYRDPPRRPDQGADSGMDRNPRFMGPPPPPAQRGMRPPPPP